MIDPNDPRAEPDATSNLPYQQEFELDAPYYIPPKPPHNQNWKFIAAGLAGLGVLLLGGFLFLMNQNEANEDAAATGTPTRIARISETPTVSTLTISETPPTILTQSVTETSTPTTTKIAITPLTPTPTETEAPTPTATVTMTLSPTPTETPSPTATYTFTPSSTRTPSPSPSITNTRTHTPAPRGVIAFTSERDGDNDVYLIDQNGTITAQLTNHPAKDEDPAPSPDGRTIAFTTHRDGNWEIYAMNVDGSDTRNLTGTGSDEYVASWSPDGSQIVFYSTRDDGRQIYVMNANGSNQRRISTPDDIGDTDDWAPAWSPNGAWIAYQTIPHRKYGGDGTAEIYRIDPQGNDKRNLTNRPGADDESPAWSPDSSQVVFQSNRNGNYDIWVMNADGSDQRALTDGAGDDEYPAWSRDGRSIVFQSTRDGNYEIYVMNADGTNVRRLTNDPGEEEYADWMP